MVHPVPDPDPTNKEPSMKAPLNGKNQNLMLLRRGKHISCVPKRMGNNILPNAPIKIGITIKKIIKKACIVTTLL